MKEKKKEKIKSNGKKLQELLAEGKRNSIRDRSPGLSESGEREGSPFLILALFLNFRIFT